MKDDRVYVRHALSCIAAIRDYLAADPDALHTDRKTQKAVLRELHELAESTQRFSAETTRLAPHIPWANIGGFRNVIVHDYLGLNLDRIQQVIRNDLPDLERALRDIEKRLE